jgi:transposase-like protein
MRRYSEALPTDVRKRMNPPHRQSVVQIYQALGIHQATLYNWRKSWRLQGKVVRINQPTDDFVAQTATLALAA